VCFNGATRLTRREAGGCPWSDVDEVRGAAPNYVSYAAPRAAGGDVIDLSAAVAFVATHGRVLDRRRLDLRLGGDTRPAEVFAALGAYRNSNGGYGWGLEPDLRSHESQPAAAMHAFEVLADAAPATTPAGVELCDWLAAHTLSDGGLPLALAVSEQAGNAPFWNSAASTISSLQMTAQVAANAHLVARFDRGVQSHPWLAAATTWSLSRIDHLAAPSAHELLWAVRFLDAAAPVQPVAASLVERLGHLFASDDGVVPVAGGAEGESLRPLDFARDPEGPARRLFRDEVVVAELDRLAARQQPDGGWAVDFASASPAAALEWRGYVTVEAVSQLLRDGRGHR
jgi:hypothetical protein